MNVVFEINGGLGKSIAATVVCSIIKKKYPKSKLIVVTHWKDVFLNNPNVDVCVKTGENLEFYSKYVENQEVLFLTVDPYSTHGYITQSKHLIQSWLDFIGETYNGELPELYFTPQEEQYYKQNFKTPKPLFLIHPNGGGNPNHLGGDKYNWARDIPPNVVQAIIDKYKDQYTVGVIRTESQIKYNNCVDLVEKWRMVHIAAALDLKSTVLWNVTKPQVFGYPLHDNLMANPYNKEQKATSSYVKFGISEPLQNMPYNSFNDVFSFEKIIKSIENQ
jgi:hypothetical protein